MTCGRVYDRRRYWPGFWGGLDYPFCLNMVPILVDYEKSGRIGPLVLDLGCSCNPVTNWLSRSGHRRILLDICEEVHTLSSLADSPLTVSCDLCTFEPDSQDFLAFAKVYRQLDANGLDAIVSADNLINYIPWRSVFTVLDSYLKDSGLVFLCFGIDIGRGEAFHADRPGTSADVLSFFTDDLGYRIAEYGSQQGCHGVVFEKQS